MCVGTLSSDPAHLHFSLNCLPNEEEIKKINVSTFIMFQCTVCLWISRIKGSLSQKMPAAKRFNSSADVLQLEKSSSLTFHENP